MKYLAAFFLLLAVEIFIALFVHDKIVRPYVGDILVVILLYALVRSFFQNIRFLPVFLFLFAALVECAQYFRVVDRLGLGGNRLLSTVVGTLFDWADILCYFIAAVLLAAWEHVLKAKGRA